MKKGPRPGTSHFGRVITIARKRIRRTGSQRIKGRGADLSCVGGGKSWVAVQTAPSVLGEPVGVFGKERDEKKKMEGRKELILKMKE